MSERVHPLAASKATVLVSPSDKVRHSEHPFVNAQGLRINSQTFAPLDGIKPLGCVLVVHGLNTHVGYSFASFDYTYAGSVLQRYVEARIVTHSIDIQGFGKSEGVGGKRGHIELIEHVVDDLLRLCTLLKSRYPLLPLLLHGQCFGGAMATWAAQRAAPGLLRGAILTVPNIALAPEAIPSPMIVAALGAIAACAPALQILHEPDDSDADFQFRFASDPFCYTEALRAGWCNELRLMYLHFERSAEEMTLPFLVVQSVRDDFCNPQGSFRLFEQARSSDKTLIEVQNMGHAVITEDGCDDVLDVVITWAVERLSAPATAPAFAAVARRSALTVRKKTPALTFAGAATALTWKNRLRVSLPPRGVNRRANEVWLLRG